VLVCCGQIFSPSAQKSIPPPILGRNWLKTKLKVLINILGNQTYEMTFVTKRKIKHLRDFWKTSQPFKLENVGQIIFSISNYYYIKSFSMLTILSC